MLLCRLYFVKPHGLLVLLHRKCYRYCHITLHHLKLFCHQYFELLLYVCIFILRRNGMPIFRPDLSNLLCVLMLFWINKCFFSKNQRLSYTDWKFYNYWLFVYWFAIHVGQKVKHSVGYLHFSIVSKYVLQRKKYRLFKI